MRCTPSSWKDSFKKAEAENAALKAKLDAIESASEATAKNHCGTGCTSCGSFWTLTGHQGKAWHYDFCQLQKLKEQVRGLREVSKYSLDQAKQERKYFPNCEISMDGEHDDGCRRCVTGYWITILKAALSAQPTGERDARI